MARPRGNSWQGMLKVAGKAYRYSFPTQKAAELWEAEARAARSAGRPIPKPSTVIGGAPTIRSFFEGYGREIWYGKGWKNVTSTHRAIEGVMGADTPLSSITEPFLKDAIATMRDKGWAATTINVRMSHVTKLLREANSRGLEVVTTKAPWVDQDINDHPHFLTEDEEKAFLDLLREWGWDKEASLCETLIDTGCRPSELVRNYGDSGEPIRWKEVSKSAGGTAPDLQGRPVIYIKRTKTGRDRMVGLTPRAKNNFLTCKQYGQSRPFENQNASVLSQKVRKAFDHLGLDEYVLYTLRHTCASRMVQRGADIRRLKDWMGHTDIKTTLRYAKLAPSDIIELGDLMT